MCCLWQDQGKCLSQSKGRQRPKQAVPCRLLGWTAAVRQVDGPNLLHQQGGQVKEPHQEPLQADNVFRYQ